MGRRRLQAAFVQGVHQHWGQGRRGGGQQGQRAVPRAGAADGQDRQLPARFGAVQPAPGLLQRRCGIADPGGEVGAADRPRPLHGIRPAPGGGQQFRP
ncbi:hypothetical protein DS843_30095 [Roseomonas genomospecies 6]|uniref:Uncharacterized protein n=1 Tax=Roseomonas genomospecies 6 TaxID=214106 RepID=A0A9W7NFS9_9PROT|nr:hypothetical protein DS843_30095 [Roseomonas genomospecies 6]